MGIIMKKSSRRRIFLKEIGIVLITSTKSAKAR